VRLRRRLMSPRRRGAAATLLDPRSSFPYCVDVTYKDIASKGLWIENPGLVQLLGLCPLLAVSNSVVSAVSLGLATTLVIALANGAVSAVRHLVPWEVRVPVFILIIAVLVTVVDLLMNAYLHPLSLALGIFVPLIVTNCLVLARAETFASKSRPLLALWDGACMGLGLTAVLTLLGAMREIAGRGTLLSGIDLVLGEAARPLVVTLIPDYAGFLLAVLPPGAFIGLGLLIALKNLIDQRATKERAVPALAST
jgi:Na+-translocating ferredoxin:NAD+ oxidoreductase subunit E